MTEIEIESHLPSLMKHPQSLDTLAKEWFQLDVANGDAREDTIRTYLSHLRQWVEWCKINEVDPANATDIDIKRYRQFLVKCEAKHATITLKLTTMRRFYQAALDRSLINVNPVQNIKAPRNREASDSLTYLSLDEANQLISSIPLNGSLTCMRDRALIGLMALEGLRRIEVVRANVEDMESMEDGSIRILVRGKGKDRYIYPRNDTIDALNQYLNTRNEVAQDNSGVPIFVRIDKAGNPLSRISRGGVNYVIDSYLVKAGIKREGISCHALRHFCGRAIYVQTKDLKKVQEVLGHENINNSAKYARSEERNKARHTVDIPVKL